MNRSNRQAIPSPVDRAERGKFYRLWYPRGVPAPFFPLYLLEQSLFTLFRWIPTPIGMGLRGIFYRLILKMDGWAAIENGARLRFANYIHLRNGAYLDEGVYRSEERRVGKECRS